MLSDVSHYRISCVNYTYPVMLDVSERLAVVIGGGPVAARKVAG